MHWCLLLALAIGYVISQTLPPLNVRNRELVEFSKVLRNIDYNKAQPGQIIINYQAPTKSNNAADNAKDVFFTAVDPTLLKKPSFRQFIDLMDNYNRKIGVPEPRVSLEEEKREIAAFLDTVLASKPFKKLYDFLRKKEHPFASSPSIFRQWIEHLWFHHYSRSKGKLDTSGFEHVFIGEKKGRQVGGLHNWVRFYYLEQNRTEDFDYKGFIVKRGNVMASLKYSWKGDLKRTGSLLIGTSPEYEMALYTLCFLARGEQKEQCHVEIDGCPFSITSYKLIQKGEIFIGTVYPIVGKMTDTCERM